MKAKLGERRRCLHISIPSSNPGLSRYLGILAILEAAARKTESIRSVSFELVLLVALYTKRTTNGRHPLVNPSHIIGGAIRPDENLTIDDGKYESLAAYHLLPGDVVLGRRGEIGRCAVVKTDGLICGTGSMIIRPGQKVRSDYLQRVVSFPSFSHALEANAVGATTKNLNAKIVGSAEAFLPDLKDQDAFITLVSQIDK